MERQHFYMIIKTLGNNTSSAIWIQDGVFELNHSKQLESVELKNIQDENVCQNWACGTH